MTASECIRSFIKLKRWNRIILNSDGEIFLKNTKDSCTIGSNDIMDILPVYDIVYDDRNLNSFSLTINETNKDTIMYYLDTFYKYKENL